MSLGGRTDSFNPKAYWEERLSANRGLLGVGYLNLGRNYNQWLYRVRRRVFRREVRSIPIGWQAANVLDVGSGTGFYIRLWEEIGAGSVTGTDLTTVAVGRLKQQFPGRDFFELDIGESLNDFVPASFDVISAFDVLFHIVDDEKYRRAISNIHALLRPGGWFLFSDTLLHSPSRRGVHMVERSIDDVESTLEKVGFQVIRRKPIFVLMNFPTDGGGAQRWLWKALTYPVLNGWRLAEFMGAVLGASLYPVETVLTKLMHEGPSTELVISRKRMETPGKAMVDTLTAG